MIASSTSLAREHESLLLQILRDIVGSRVQLEHYSIANQRGDYYVLLVKLRQPQLDVLVKLAGPAATMVPSFTRAAFVHQLVASTTTIPMPNVLAVDDTCSRWPWRYMVRTQITGQVWAVVRQSLDHKQLQAAHGKLGEVVAQIHRVRLPAFGELGANGVVAAADFREALRGHACGIIRKPEHLELFLRLIEDRADLFTDVEGPALCHDDLHQHNILFKHTPAGWRLATVLDFDKAWPGHDESDLARLELWQGMTSSAFWDSYTEVHRPAPAYQQRRNLYQLLWCLEFAVASPQHHADTAGVCQQLGLAPIKFV